MPSTISRCLLRNHYSQTVSTPLAREREGRRGGGAWKKGVDVTYRGDLVGGRVLDDGDDALKLLRGELTGPLLQVDIGLLADKVG